MRPAEARLIQQLRQSDLEAGHQFVRDYYPDVYRYLLYLTGRIEIAEDLTQETFLQAWRGLAGFEGRASLRVWLHRIARREFLQVLRSQRPQASLEEVAELVTAPDANWVGAVELRNAIRTLSPEQAEVVVLHYLHGYDCAEIARIVGAHVSTVKYRLSRARLHLERELGEGDLLYLNEPAVPMRQWAWLPLDQMYALETRLSTRRAEDRNTPRPGATMEETMERREFLRQTAVGAVGMMLTETEKEIVDSRLTQKVTCAFKGTALSDLCEKLKTDTGIPVTAGPSVADEKVTLFCEKLPLREVMRQLSRPFGYTWLRSGTSGQYRYELMQDLRSQLLEEELRNRDRNEALLALEREIERFRPYLPLSPDEALAKAKTAPEAEKPLLEKMAGVGWGPIQMYFRLSSQQHLLLRTGETLFFSEEPKAGQFPLPEEMARGVLQCNRDWRILGSDENGFYGSYAGPGETPNPQSVPLTAAPVVRAQLYVQLSQSELGQFELDGASGFFTPLTAGKARSSLFQGASHYVVGRGPRNTRSESGAVNPKLAHDSTLRQQVSIQPQPSYNLLPRLSPGSERLSEERGEVPEPKVTMADVQEVLYQTTRLPIVADFYTRLYKPEAVSVKNLPLSEALNQITQAMRLRWSRDGNWLQFRSATYYHDRLKEVPNRHLSRWAVARRQQAGTHEVGGLSLDQIVEIAQLTDDQLDGSEMAEGAIECWGLKEWHLLQRWTSERRWGLRGHVRFLAEFTPDQRREMMSAEGLPLKKMTLAQQQGFITRAFLFDNRPLHSLEELQGATLRVDLTQPGWYQWIRTGDLSARRWAVSLGPGPDGRRVVMPPVRERTREAALQTARRLFPPVTDAELIPQPEQIAPTEQDLVIVYIPGISNARSVLWIRVNQQLTG
jgi:RNA polymerase sigma-70 factor, ECF subfamily